MQAGNGGEDPLDDDATAETQTQDDDTPSKSQANAVRKRSKKACLNCRSRKVRCDVSRRQPCTNCEHEDTECIVQARKPRRSRTQNPDLPAYSADQNQQKSSSTPVGFQSKGNNAAQVGSSGDEKYKPTPETPGSDLSSLTDTTASFNQRRIPHSHEHVPQFGHNPAPLGSARAADDARRYGYGAVFPGYGADDGATNVMKPAPEDFLANYGSIPDWSFNPEFITESLGDLVMPHPMPRLEDFAPMPSQAGYLPQLEPSPIDLTWHMIAQPRDLIGIPSEDVNFLMTKGCLHIPYQQAFHEIILAYFRWVHPSLPLINESEFWSLCLEPEHGLFDVKRFSLFVVQSMLFAGCAFASEETVSHLGFGAIREARYTFYRRAKLLFDFDAEGSPYNVACGSILLAYHAPNKNERQVNTFWLEEAIRSARLAGADKYQEKMIESRDYATKLKKLWWCCIFRDRILPIGVRRPLHISSEQFYPAPETKMSLDDFKSDMGKSRVYPMHTQQQLYQIFVLACRLAEILTGVVSQVYPVDRKSRTVPIPEPEFVRAMESLSATKSALDDWLQTATFQFTPPFCLGPYEESVAVFANLLYMFHDGSMLAVYNEMAFLWEFRQDVDDNLRANRLEGINHAIVNVVSALTNKVQELVQAKLIKYLPISVCAFLMLPMCLHLFSMKCASTPLKAALRRRQFEIHMETMRMQRVNFDGTDFIVEYIENFAKFIDRACPIARPIDNQRPSPYADPNDSPDMIGSWEELLTTSPRLYLRFVMHLDVTLATGHYIEDHQFPPPLRKAMVGLG